MSKGRLAIPTKLLYWIFTGKRLPREEHREPVYDLSAASKDVAIHFVYELLDQTITKSPTDRLPDATVVESRVEAVIAKLRVNAHFINLTSPQRCIYCGDGWYRVEVAPHQHLHRDQVKDRMRQFGLEPRDGVLVFRCENCGNVQIFQNLDPQNDIWAGKKR